MQMHAGGCCCGCCFLSIIQTGFAWSGIPQRFSVNSAAWSWSMPSGLSQVSVPGPLTPAVEVQLYDQIFNAVSIVKSLSSVGQNNTAWCMNSNKYGAAFGAYPAHPAYAVDASADAQWLAVDDQSVTQWYHPAYGVYNAGGVGGSVKTIKAECDSYIVDMIDDSANNSGATPWRTYDTTAIAALSAYPQYFLDYDYRCSNTTLYSVPFDECFGGAQTAWQSTTVTFGTTMTLSVSRQLTGQCKWLCRVRLKPRFSIWSNAFLSRIEFYGRSTLFASPGSMVDPAERIMYASGYIRTYATPLSGFQRRYSGNFGYVHHSAPVENGDYKDAIFGQVGWQHPPYMISRGYGVGGLPYDDVRRFVNTGSPLQDGSVSAEPPGGWRTALEFSYLSDRPIDCREDIDNSNPVSLSLVETPPTGYATWAAFLAECSQAFGLSSPPATMTIQRLSDIA